MQDHGLNCSRATTPTPLIYFSMIIEIAQTYSPPRLPRRRADPGFVHGSSSRVSSKPTTNSIHRAALLSTAILEKLIDTNQVAPRTLNLLQAPPNNSRSRFASPGAAPFAVLSKKT